MLHLLVRLVSHSDMPVKFYKKTDPSETPLLPFEPSVLEPEDFLEVPGSRYCRPGGSAVNLVLRVKFPQDPPPP
jgi:hypothetical protein